MLFSSELCLRNCLNPFWSFIYEGSLNIRLRCSDKLRKSFVFYIFFFLVSGWKVVYIVLCAYVELFYLLLSEFFVGVNEVS